MSKNCEHCGKFFKAKMSNQLCCSRKCIQDKHNKKAQLVIEAKKPTLTCEVCSKKFKPQGNRRKNCSKECSRKAVTLKMRIKQGINPTDKKFSDEKGVCECCGKEFSKIQVQYNKQYNTKYKRIRTYKKFCSEECRITKCSPNTRKRHSEANKKEVVKRLGAKVTCENPLCKKQFNRLEKQTYTSVLYCTEKCREDYNRICGSIKLMSPLIEKEQISQDRLENQQALLEAKRVWKEVTGKQFTRRI